MRIISLLNGDYFIDGTNEGEKKRWLFCKFNQSVSIVNCCCHFGSLIYDVFEGEKKKKIKSFTYR